MNAERLPDVRMRGFARRVEVGFVQARIRERTAPLEAEAVPLGVAAGRVLAADVRSEVAAAGRTRDG